MASFSESPTPTNPGDTSLFRLSSQKPLLVDNLRQAVYLGATSHIHVGQWDGRTVAIKIRRLHQDDDETILQREAFVLQRLRTLHIVQFLGTATEVSFRSGGVTRVPCLVLEWMEHKDLVAFLRFNPLTDRLRLFTLVAKAVDMIHGEGVIHGNLQGTNILMNVEGMPYLCGFGLAKHVEETTQECNATPDICRASPRWQAPELFKGSPERTISSDVYALGCVAVEIFTAGAPFPRILRDAAVVGPVVLRGTLPIQFDDLPTSLKERRQVWGLMLRCWDVDASKRPSTQEIVGELQLIVNAA